LLGLLSSKGSFFSYSCTSFLFGFCFFQLFLCFSVVFVEEGIRIVIVLKRCVGMLVAWVSGKIPQIDQSKGKKRTEEADSNADTGSCLQESKGRSSCPNVNFFCCCFW